MEVSERKQYKNIQFTPEQLQEILELSEQLTKELNIKLSQSATVMYAIRRIKQVDKSKS